MNHPTSRPETRPLPPAAHAASAELELAQRAAAGDAAAFTAIMRRYNRRLFRTARSILATDADAEDALQEGYLHAWRSLHGFRGEASLSTWMVRIVANAALARLRKAAIPAVPLDDAMSDGKDQTAFAATTGSGPEGTTVRAQLRRLLEARIDELPEAFRAVFMLRGVEEMSVEEVAQALDIPEATVRTRYFRARKQLRKALGGEIDQTLRDAFAFDGARCDRMVAGVLVRAQEEGLIHTP
jgi:RNA polymerase sigma-70 factor (ECF subfamily)